MCGIAGVLAWDGLPDLSPLKMMTECLEHRGPDADGLEVLGPVALGFRRLSIIDLSDTANQPLVDHSGQFWIVFNGEIYNYRALRMELTAAGAHFKTSGDTEVILEAYKRWGVDCLQRLNGMFAFAIWDVGRQRLFLARDRAGEKPLYYQPLPDGGLAFASELKALRLHPKVSNRINPTALGHFLSINYTLTSACILDGVQKLPAAHYLLVERDKSHHPVLYWDLAPHFRNKRRFRSEDEAAEALAALIDDAVQLRLVSDVPLGAFLSGGIDSSTIAAAMSRLGRPADVKTFSIGFNESSYDELPEARAAAAFLNIDHREKVVHADMASALPRIVASADEPFADTSMIPMYFLAEFARQQVTVCLSGDGSDEIFAGYETYPADKVLNMTSWLPAGVTRTMYRVLDDVMPVSFDAVSLDYRLRKFLRGHPLGSRRAHYFWRVIFDERAKRRLLRPEWHDTIGGADPYLDFEKYHEDVADCHFLDQASYVDIKTWLVDDILVKVDRTTMAHSLEARTPFLDHRLIELAAALPVEWKLKRFRKKHLLKKSQAPYLPGQILHRKKHGFNSPVSEWFNAGGSLADVAEAVTRSETLAQWFDRRAVDELWREHRAKTVDHGLKLFGLTCLGLWMESLSQSSQGVNPIMSAGQR